MIRFASTALCTLLVVACGGSSLPPAKVAETQSSISAATAVGADQNPQAALHLKMARDQLKQAQGLVEDGKDDEARLVLTREAQASANAQKARADVDGLQNRNQ
jgi:hypothetical protein